MGALNKITSVSNLRAEAGNKQKPFVLSCLFDKNNRERLLSFNFASLLE